MSCAAIELRSGPSALWMICAAGNCEGFDLHSGWAWQLSDCSAVELRCSPNAQQTIWAEVDLRSGRVA
jgi:hypothetical protein